MSEAGSNQNNVSLKVSDQKKQQQYKKVNPVTRFFIALVVIFVVVPGILIGLPYALFYDATHTKIHTRDNYPIGMNFQEC